MNIPRISPHPTTLPPILPLEDHADHSHERLHKAERKQAAHLNMGGADTSDLVSPYSNLIYCNHHLLEVVQRKPWIVHVCNHRTSFFIGKNIHQSTGNISIAEIARG